MLFYIEATPETIIFIVTTGKCPGRLSGIKSSTFNLWKNPAEFALHSATNDQAFILHVDIVEHVETNFIKPEWIKCVYVYSQQGCNLLNGLFNGVCPKPIVILPEIYPASFSTTFPLPLTFSSPSQRLIERLSTPNQHIALLKNAFKDAKKNILITTYGVNDQTLLSADLYNLISETPSNVKIYIYNNHDKPVAKNILNFFDTNGVNFDYTDTHSKILAVDENYIAAGSFNWLSTVNDEYKGDANANASCVVRGNAGKQLIKDVWKYIRHYRNYQFGNIRALEEFESDPSNYKLTQYSIQAGSCLKYLATLEQHIDFIDEYFETASTRIIICSPFISESSAIDFTPKKLLSVVNRGVDIYFVCLRSQILETQFDEYLSNINSSKIHLVPIDNIHLKTFIIDSDTIAEGSFNWLSASRDESSEHHNHEVTLVTSGKIAKEFIEQFEQSELGANILSASHMPKTKRQRFSLKE